MTSMSTSHRLGQRSKGLKVWRHASRHVAVFTILMGIMGFLPSVGAAAQSQTAAQVQQGQGAPAGGTGSIEIHLADCPPGFDESTGSNYYDDCHSHAAENIDITLESVDPALGVDQTRASEKAEENGPGIGFFGDLPAGDYTVSVNWPSAATDSFWSYCSVADSDQEIAVTPNDGPSGQLSLDEGQQIICDWYIAHAAGDVSTIELSAFDCAADAIAPTDNPELSDFQSVCTDPAPEIDFHLVDTATDADTVQATDRDGTSTFTFDPASTVEFYSDVPLEANEWMFCATDNEAPRLIAFDEHGVTIFDGGDPKTLACTWFLIDQEPDAPAQPTGSTAAPATAQTTSPGADSRVNGSAGEQVPAEAQGGSQASTTAQIAISPFTCPQGYDETAQGLDYATFAANCGEPLADVSFNLTAPDGTVDTRVSDGLEPITYASLPSGTYTLYSDIPLEAATEYLFCTADGGNRYQKDFNESGVTTYSDVQREQIACDWFVVPTSLRGEESGGSLEVHLAACPTAYTGNQLYDDCHGNGIADQQFTLTSGPDGAQTGTTIVPQTPGPGTVAFTDLGTGEYTLQGGPPGDFGKVKLFCNVQPDNTPVDVSVDSTTATFAIGENEHVLCDWYYIPEDARGQGTPTPTPSPAPSRAEILVTLHACPPASSDSGTYGGATQKVFEDSCTETVNDVPFTLGDVGAPPLEANTGVSGDGAVRFYDLLPADYTLAPKLGADLSSAAIFCRIGDGDPYQKALQNGATTFVNVDGESISCDWYVVKTRQTQPAGPSGSITIREYLCQADRSEIKDWETECAPGPSGSSFSLNLTGSTATVQGTPDANGVYVFSGLNDGFYELKQDNGTWCRAVADRVDSKSRVIVQGGGNTDVVLYQCSAVTGLPTTGTGPGGTVTASDDGGVTRAEMLALALILLAAPLAVLGFSQSRKRRKVASAEQIDNVVGPVLMASGKTWMRFK